MAVSKEIESKTVDAVNWFKRLPSDKQTSIMVEYFRDSSKLAKEDLENFNLIIDDIKLNLASKPKNQLIGKLIELGFDDTISSLLVEKIDKSEPNLRASIYALKDISDQSFERLVSDIVLTFFLDWNEFSHEDTAAKSGTNINLVRSAIVVFRDGFIWSNQRGKISLKTFLSILSNQYGYSQRKISIIQRYFEQYGNDLKFANLFRELADLSADLVKTNESIAEIKAKLDELSLLLKEQDK
jgi:hypothetical protein